MSLHKIPSGENKRIWFIRGYNFAFRKCARPHDKNGELYAYWWAINATSIFFYWLWEEENLNLNLYNVWAVHVTCIIRKFALFEKKKKLLYMYIRKQNIYINTKKIWKNYNMKYVSIKTKICKVLIFSLF